MTHYDTEDLLIIVAEDQEISKDELNRHFSLYSDWLKNEKMKFSAFLSLSVCALLEKDYAKCDQYLEALGVTNEELPSALIYFTLGLKYQKTHKISLAIDSFQIALRQGLSLKNKTFLAHCKIIDCHIALRNYQEAIQYFNSFTDHFSQEIMPKIMCSIGYCYEMISDLPNALHIYKTVSENSSYYSEICGIWVNFLSGDFKTLAATLPSLREKYEKFSHQWYDVQYLFAQYYMGIGENEEALKILQEISKVGYHQEYYLCMLGNLWVKLQGYSEAFICYLSAASANQGLPEIWFNLAVIYLKVGQDEYQIAFEKAKSLDKSRLLPQEISLNCQTFTLRLNLAEFGCGVTIPKEKSKSNASAQRNAKKNNASQPKKEFEIVKPTPIKNIPTNLPSISIKTESPYSFPAEFLSFSYFHALKRLGEQKNLSEGQKGIENFSDDSQAAQTLALISSIPMKRQREDRQK